MNVQPAFLDTLDSVGRSDYGSAYRHAEHGTSDAKQSQRERVLDFILANLDSPVLKLASLPGIDWIFERMALAAYPRVQLVGIERSFTVYHQSRRLMPEHSGALYNRSGLQDRTMPYGHGNIVYSRCPAYAKRGYSCPKRSRRSHRLLLIEAEAYATAPTLDCGATRDQRYEYMQRFGHRTSIWFDFVGSLSGGMLSTLAAIHMVADANCNVPFVVTFLAARDSFHADASRIQRIASVQPRLSITDNWKYVGHNGAPMLTVCGVIRKESRS